VRRGTSETTDHCIAHITWLCNKDKRAQRERLQGQLRTTMKEQYKQERAGQETQSNKGMRTNKRSQKEQKEGANEEKRKPKWKTRRTRRRREDR
jgi:hypothetical protein